MSGVTLTVGAVAWAAASAVQARLAMGAERAVRTGTVLLASGAAIELVTAALTVAGLLAVAGAGPFVLTTVLGGLAIVVSLRVGVSAAGGTPSRR